jgi:hypothetical protein
MSPSSKARTCPRTPNQAAPVPLVAVRKNLDLVWVWFYKDVVPTALFKSANLPK